MAAREECYSGKEKLQRRKEGQKWEYKGRSLVPLVVLVFDVRSARAVSGRRLSSCDAHNQFFCKTGDVGIDHVVNGGESKTK